MCLKGLRFSPKPCQGPYFVLSACHPPGGGGKTGAGPECGLWQRFGVYFLKGWSMIES